MYTCQVESFRLTAVEVGFVRTVGARTDANPVPDSSQVISRLTVSRPVCLGVKHSSQTRDQFFPFVL
jgi:hypothetical protein